MTSGGEVGWNANNLGCLGGENSYLGEWASSWNAGFAQAPRCPDRPDRDRCDPQPERSEGQEGQPDYRGFPGSVGGEYLVVQVRAIEALKS